MSSTKYRVNPAAVRAVRGEEGENHVEARLVLVPAAVGAPPDVDLSSGTAVVAANDCGIVILESLHARSIS